MSKMTNSGLVYGLFATFDYAEFSMEELRGLTGPFGMTETNLRSALSRMHHQGAVSIRKKGRTAIYRPTEQSRRYGGNVARAFTTPDWSDWTGEIVAVAFSFGVDSSNRYRLQKHLKIYRFAPLFSGFWIRPHREQEAIRDSFIEFLAPGSCRMTVGRLHPAIGTDDALRLWHLQDLGARMKERAETLEELLPRLKNTPPHEAFRAKMEQGDATVRILAEDPLLPKPLVPSDWPGSRLRKIFIEFDASVTDQSRPFWTRYVKP